MSYHISEQVQLLLSVQLFYLKITQPLVTKFCPFFLSVYDCKRSIVSEQQNPSYQEPGTFRQQAMDPTVLNNVQPVKNGGGDMIKMYNCGPKDVMFRSGLYSPTGTSDSSGFSEQRDSSFSPVQQASDLRMGSLPGHAHRGAFDINGRASPHVPFSYHNPALTASPYSTLPRRPGASPRFPHHSPLTLELGSTFGRPRQHHEFSAGLLTTANGPKIETKLQKVTARTPLLEDDRESNVWSFHLAKEPLYLWFDPTFFAATFVSEKLINVWLLIV